MFNCNKQFPCGVTDVRWFCLWCVHRLRLQECDFSVEELSDCSSGSIEVCCDDLTPGLMHSHTCTFLQQKTRTSSPFSLSCPLNKSCSLSAICKDAEQPRALLAGMDAYFLAAGHTYRAIIGVRQVIPVANLSAPQWNLNWLGEVYEKTKSLSKCVPVTQLLIRPQQPCLKLGIVICVCMRVSACGSADCSRILMKRQKREMGSGC